MSFANTYKITFSGKTLQNQQVSKVSQRFAEMFGISDQKILERAFSGRTNTLKRGLSYEQAQRYREHLAKIGADCCIECERNPLFVLGDVDYDYDSKKRQRADLLKTRNFEKLSLVPKA